MYVIDTNIFVPVTYRFVFILKENYPQADLEKKET